MLHKDTFKFLSDLRLNNNREWFAENKNIYETAKADVTNVAESLIKEIGKFDPRITNIEAKKTLFRIYRDTRFSLDKTPYKTHFGIAIHPESSTLKNNAGYYLHIEPNNCFLSNGAYMLTSDLLKKLRQGIYDDFESFKDILNEKQLKKEFGDLSVDDDSLQRVPNGFDKNSPAAEYLKLKHHYLMKSLKDIDLCNKDFVSKAAELYKITKPFSDFIEKVLEN